MTDSMTGFLGLETNSGETFNSNGIFSQENNANLISPHNAPTTPPYGGELDDYTVYSTLEVKFDWLSEDDNSPYGANVYAFLQPYDNSGYNDGYLNWITLMPEGGATGTFYAGGVEIGAKGARVVDNDGNMYTIRLQGNTLRISIDSFNSTVKPVDISAVGLTFKPSNGDSDKDIRFRYNFDVSNDIGGWTNASSRSSMTIDAVADIPVYLGGSDANVSVGASDDGKLSISSVSVDNGVITQTISGGLSTSGSPAVLNLGQAQFGDFKDGSEEHFVLIGTNTNAKWDININSIIAGDFPAFIAPQDGKLEEIWFNGNGELVEAGTSGATKYVKLTVNNTHLQTTNGLIDIQVPVLIKDGTDNGNYTFYAKLGSEEHPTDQEIDTSDNYTLTNAEEIEVKVQSLDSKITISTGWVYESGALAGGADNDQASPSVAPNGQGDFHPSDRTGECSAAFIDIKLELGPDDRLDGWIELSLPKGVGSIYREDGTNITSGASGDKPYATVPLSYFKNNEVRLYFVPEEDNHNIEDFDIEYSFAIKSGTGADEKIFTANDSITIVVDAVADKADVTLKPSKEAPAHDGFVLDYTPTFQNDPNEKHYIIIHHQNDLDLGDISTLPPGLVKVDQSELENFENPSDAIGHHFAFAPGDIVLRIDDMSAFANGTIELPFEVTNRSVDKEKVDVQISTVVVQGGGDNPANWDTSTDKEYDFGNNIAVTENITTVFLSNMDITPSPDNHIYEGDRAGQHLGKDDASYGTPINIAFGDQYEALHEIRFSLSEAGSTKANGEIGFGQGSNFTAIPDGGRIVFVSKEKDGKAVYTSARIEDQDCREVKTYSIDPPATLDDLNNDGQFSGLRFIPTGDSDADIEVTISARVTDVRSGDVVSKPDQVITIERDAVADLPQNLSVEAEPDNGYEAFAAKDGVDITLKADFSDYSDGSEAHYFFIAKGEVPGKDIIASISNSSLPTGLELVDASQIWPQVDKHNELAGLSANDIFAIKVSSQYLKDHTGNVNVKIKGVIAADVASTDGASTIAVKAVAVEHDGYLTDKNIGSDAEPDNTNNVAVKGDTLKIKWAQLENEFDFTPQGNAYEDDKPNQHIDDSPQENGGVAIHIVPRDESEVFDTLTIAYNNEDGSQAKGIVKLTVAGQSLEIASGTTLNFTYAQPNSNLCTEVSYIDVKGAVHNISVPGLTLAELSKGLRYVPRDGADNDADADVKITFSGTTRETTSGETGKFAAKEITVEVDAVADLPGGDKSDYQYGNAADGSPLSAIEAGVQVSFAINTSFSDFSDGSEAHYLFIDTTYFANGDFTLEDARGPFTQYTRVTGDDLARLNDQINANPNISAGSGYAVLKIDPSQLGPDGKLDLTLTANLLDASGMVAHGAQNSSMSFAVKAVAVEYDGYKTDPQNDVDNTNNVAIRDLDVAFAWDNLGGVFTAAPEAAYEGDIADQHNGGTTPKNGAALAITPADPTEIFTSMTITYDDAHGKMKFVIGTEELELASGAQVAFSYGDSANPTHITGITSGTQTITVSGLTLAELTGKSLFYVPNPGDDDDGDIKVKIVADTKETTLGITGTSTVETVIVVDAVADKPVGTSASYTAPGSNSDVVIVNPDNGIDNFGLTLNATFADYEDGSERHFFFISKDYVSSVDTLPSGLNLVTDAKTILDFAGLNDNYIVLEVDSSHLIVNSGVADFTLNAHLYADKLPKVDGDVSVDIKAAAIEHSGLLTPVNGAEIPPHGLADHGQDADRSNNVSLADMGLDVSFARLNNKFELLEANAYEGDAPDQHEGNYGEVYGAPIHFKPNNASEVFNTLKVEYDDAHGLVKISLPCVGGNETVELPDGAQLAFTYRNNGAGVTDCVKVSVTIGGVTTDYNLGSATKLADILGTGRLTYVPDTGSQSDADVPITFSGEETETATGEKGAFKASVVVKVDAAADQPVITAATQIANSSTQYQALAPGKGFTITLNANFGSDIEDGSESHYFFISKEYLSSLKDPLSSGIARQLSDTEAQEVCSRVTPQNSGQNGIDNASSNDWYVLEVDNNWLRQHGGSVSLQLEGTLKSAAELKGQNEEESHTLDIRAVAVEHEGFLTDPARDYGPTHGNEVTPDNNVSVVNASGEFRFASIDGKINSEVTPAYEGDEPRQHLGEDDAGGGSFITLAPRDDSEVFTDLTINNYDARHGSLVLTDDNGKEVTLASGVKLEFVYSPTKPTECVAINVLQPGATSPFDTLHYADKGGNGLDLATLTTTYLKYQPAKGDNDDKDVTVSYTANVRETATGEEVETNGSFDIVVDAVADMAENAEVTAAVLDGDGKPIREGAYPGETLTITINADFNDYDDGSEAHYILISKHGWPTTQPLDNFPAYAQPVKDAGELADIFTALKKEGGTGIYGGVGASDDYYVLKVDNAYLKSEDSKGHVSFDLQVPTASLGAYLIEAKAVSIEHQGHATEIDGIGGSADKDVDAENNVAVANMDFTLHVREFTPGKVTVKAETEWAFENDRSVGDDRYYEKGSTADRDHGVRLLYEGQGEGNVVSEIVFEYSMPSNGSTTPHRIESYDPATPINPDGSRPTNPNVNVSYQIIPGSAGQPGTVIATVTAIDPFKGVGELHFVPGDNYDNDDVDIKVLNVNVADPFILEVTSNEDDNWGSGIAGDQKDIHVKVDAVAQAPEVDDLAVSHDTGTHVLAGNIIEITGKVSYEDLADGSEEHFLLLEMRDGYYPDSVTLSYNNKDVPITIQHYDPVTGTPANYTLQKLVTPDDGQEHLFIKLPVDSELHQLMGNSTLERMDDIGIKVGYQTREWAPEGVALHFAAISTEDVAEVREYDPGTLDITNDELPFDKQLLQYVPDLFVMDNNTAITVAAQGAYVFWDEFNSDVLNFKGFVFENDRPSDHQRTPAYILHREYDHNHILHVEQEYPVDKELRPYDPVQNTGRDYGTGLELLIPQHTTSIKITEAPVSGISNGEGDFYFLPRSVWQAYMTSLAPLYDTALAGYKVNLDHTVKAQGNDYTLVFIPKHEPYNGAHEENDANGSHNDLDFRFNYELGVSQFNAQGDYLGEKWYYGEDQVIRVDAVANQADIISAETSGPEQFSLWNIRDTATTTKFDLTVSFHDLDETEDHYILVQEVPNFAFRCKNYYYNPAASGSVASQDADSIYTHVQTLANGSQKFIRYYKIPVNMADIDPVTGEVTYEVEFIRQPGMPSVADYPSSDLLSYGALTEDKTSSRWDSNNPNDPNFVNRKGADGEFSYENNTSVIIRNGIGNGADDAGYGPGWWDDGTGGSGDIKIENGYIHWEKGPGSSWSGGYWPTGEDESGLPIGGGASLDEYWNPAGPAGGGEWWTGIGSGGEDEKKEGWVPAGGGAWKDLPGGGVGGDDDGDGGWQANKWIANHDKGIAVEWVYENSTPNGHLQWGQYNNVIPTRMYLTGEIADAAYLELRVPNINSELIITKSGQWVYDNRDDHPRATFAIGTDPKNLSPVPYALENGEVVFRINAPGGELPNGEKLFMFVSPDSKGEDFQLGVTWYDNNGDVISAKSGQFDILVDAVAQWANFGFEEGHQDGVYGVTGDSPSQLVDVDITAFFLDQDGSEANYVLVERLPGVLPLHKGPDGQYEAIREVYLEGKTYLLIEPTKDEQQNNRVHLEFSVNHELTSPMYIEEFEYQNQMFDAMKITVGTMTVEGQTGWGASDSGDPANWEYTLRNNTSLNIQEGALTIAISKVNAEGGNSAIHALETGNPEDHLIRLDPASDNGLNLSWDANDILLSLIFTGYTGNGSFFYEDANGDLQPLQAGVDMKDEYLAGKIFHKQNKYDDSDATLSWTAEFKDGLSDYSETSVSGTLTVVVDAVASADEIHLQWPVHNKSDNTLTQTLQFDDFQANEQHYAVLAPDLYRVVAKTAKIIDQSGNVLTTAQVETIFSPDGKPYYGVRLDGYLDATGTATVQFSMTELKIQDIDKYPIISGGVSIEPNSGYYATDREPDHTNNWAINTRVDIPGQGSVSATSLAFEAPAIKEGDGNGATITLVGSLGDNNFIQSATLTFTQAARMADIFDGNAGDQVATIVYAGECYPVTLDGSGAATVFLDFGSGAFDPAADFRIIWGNAHMDSGQLVVEEWNHHADGTLNLTTDFTVVNQLSGQSGTISGNDPDGIALIPAATPGEDISGSVTAINGNPVSEPVGAGTDEVTITLTGTFPDNDGSESHYLLLELRDGWQCVSHASAPIEQINGVSYLRLEVDPRELNPEVEVTLIPSAGIKGDITLRTASSVVEGGNGDAITTTGTPVSVSVSGISATGVSAQTITGFHEDELVSLSSLVDASLVRGDDNDVLRGVTFTDLQEGSLVDRDGAELSSWTVSADDLANVFYRPKANYAGDQDGQGRPQPVTLSFDALIGETNTGATSIVKDQKLNVALVPEADAPDNVCGVSLNVSLDNVQSGHKAQIAVTLHGEFADTDGSEDHFFLVSAPAGVRVLAGEGYTVSTFSALTDPGLASALDVAAPAFAASGTVYRVSLSNSETAAVSLPVNLEITTTIYNGGQLLVAGAASEMLADGSRDYGVSVGSPVNLPPRVGPEFGNQNPDAETSAVAIDSLRQPDITGSVNMKVDPDDDDLIVSGLSFNNVQGTQATVDGKPCFSVQGQYGTLYVFEDGNYRYERDASGYGVTADEVFTYQLADAYGGSGESTITISLAATNTAPVGDPVSDTVGSVRQMVVEGVLSLSDPNGDAVTIAAVGGNSAQVNIGTAASPLMAFEAEGSHGIVHVFEDSGQWKYRYTLDNDHRGETGTEVFSFTVRDEHGMTGDSVIAIDLYIDNASPVADNASSSMDTLRDADGIVAGSAALNDDDGDAVSLVSASGFGGKGEWGADDKGDYAYIVLGQYGTLYMYEQDGSAIQYRYVLAGRPTGGISATESFTYNVDDGHLGTGSGTVVIDLTNANAKPEISGDIQVGLDSLRASQASGTLVFSDPDYNPDHGRNDLVTLSALSFNGTAGVSDGNGGFTVAGSYGVFRIAADGSYTYEMYPESAGMDESDAFMVTVTDEYGASRDETVVIDLFRHNQDPTATSGRISLNTWRGGGKASDSVSFDDADRDPVHLVSLTGAIPGVWDVDDEGHRILVGRGDHGVLYLREDGSYRYILNEGADGVSGADTFTYTVADPYGGSTQATIVIDLDDANANPVVAGDLATSIGGSMDRYPDGIVWESGTLTWNDVDGDAIVSVSIGGDTLPGAGETVINGTYGTLKITTDGSSSAAYVYTMNPGLDSEGIRDVDRFDIVVTDEYGGRTTEALAINLAPLSHRPECDDVNYNWPRSHTGNLASVLDGQLSFRDADLEHDDTESLQLIVNGEAVGSDGSVINGDYGVLDIKADGTFSYRSPQHLGDDVLETFTYTVTDQAGNQAIAHLYIRLGDNSSPFPNTGTTEPGIVPVGSGQADNIFADFTFLDTVGPDTAPHSGSLGHGDNLSTSSNQEVDDVELVNVPLPYDPAEPGLTS